MGENVDEKLNARMRELKDLGGVLGLLNWDQETYMPHGAAAARGEQAATVQALYHERLTAPEVGDWLQACAARGGDDGARVRVLRMERDRAVKVPASLVKELAAAQVRGVGAWRAAKAAKNFALFQPHLQNLLELRRAQADALGHAGERYDALLEGFEPGMRVARLTPVLDSLKEKLTPLLAAITSRPKPADVFSGKKFPADAQWRFSLLLLRQMGFDLSRGRLDKSSHPFTGGTHPTDVRLTTRLDEANPLPGIFGTIHEGGHGLYEQNFAQGHYRSPLSSAPSMGLHESQSRLWENLVGRGRPYWTHFFPLLQLEFEEALRGVSLDGFLAATNKVERSLIRVEADEVSYNLHIILRYELERLLLSDQLPLADLPAEWNRRMELLLGVRPTHDAEGVLQDIHWGWGEFGYFPTYALGNLYAASFFAAAKRQLPGLENALGQGELAVLTGWLRENIHQEGYRQDAESLVRKVTGQGLTDQDFLHYLHQKYAA